MNILVLPGDGIGPEITAATMRVVERANAAFGLGLAFAYAEIGLAALERTGTTLPEPVMAAARAADGIILGPVSHNEYPPRAEGGINVSGELRVKLDLFANIRPNRTRPGIASNARTPIDLVIVRENTEGFYADRNMFFGSGEFMPTEDMALAVRKVTVAASSRIARAAFELARERRRKVTAVHKANVLQDLRRPLPPPGAQGRGRVPRRGAGGDHSSTPWPPFSCATPQHFDVIVTTNMFGDILSDEAGELSGSLGLAGSLNAGDSHAFAQAQHGSAPDIAGRNIANPTALILSAAMLLAWLGRRHREERLSRAAAAIDAAIDATLADAALHTPDLGGSLGTDAFGAAVTEKFAALAAA